MDIIAMHIFVPLLSAFSGVSPAILAMLSFAFGILVSFGGRALAARLPELLAYEDELEEIPDAAPMIISGRLKKLMSSELMMGVLFLLAFFISPTPGIYLSFALVLSCFYVISLTDIAHFWIPAAITTPLMWIGLLASPLEPVAIERIGGAFIAGVLLYTCFLLVFFMNKFLGRDDRTDVFSGGDVALMMVGGAWVGTSYTALFAAVGAIIFMIQCLIAGKEKWLPFGPAICAGILVSMATASFSLH